ncbi:hypothetical protein V8E52_002014 [Russula decolorans]
MEQLHEHYDICITHTLVDMPDVCLKEEEVVLGMKLHVEGLVDEFCRQTVQMEETRAVSL